MDDLDLVTSLESAAVTKEREFEIYGKIVDIDQLLKCDSFEKHSQWGCPIKTDDGREGVIRVRAIDDSLYLQTIKVKGGTDGDDECEFEITRDAFNAIRGLTDSGLIKTRYKFQMTGDLCYEFDIFTKADGTVSEWVKVDIEIPGDGTIDEWLERLPDLPVELTETIVMAPGRKSPANSEFVKNLFTNEFTIPRSSNLV